MYRLSAIGGVFALVDSVLHVLYVNMNQMNNDNYLLIATFLTSPRDPYSFTATAAVDSMDIPFHRRLAKIVSDSRRFALLDRK